MLDQIMAALRQLDMLIYTLIVQRRDDDRDYHDVLSMPMAAQSAEEPGTKLTEKEIHDHILTFLAAGHETTALALVWTFYLLSQYPQVRLKLQISSVPCLPVVSQPLRTSPGFSLSTGS